MTCVLGGRVFRPGLGPMLVMAALMGATTLHAHPASTFGVRLNVSNTAVTVTLNADAAPLVAKLDALSPARLAGPDQPPPRLRRSAGALAKAEGPASEEAAERLDQFRRYASLIASLSHVTVDASRIGLVPGAIRANADGQVEIVLTAELPPNAGAITWHSSLIYGAYPLSVSHGSDPVETVFWLQGAEKSESVPAHSPGGSGTTISSYAALGFVHILPKGLDHILFVLGLFLLTPRLTPLLSQVSVFTLAHSASLGLAMSGLVSLPASIVEPLIALSIAYVGIENLFQRTLSSRRLWLVAGFGLLHGLGFAGVLSEISLPAAQWLPALFGFNLGVELGQLVVLGLAAIAMFAWTRWVADSDLWIRRPASAAIALMGVFWVIARV